MSGLFSDRIRGFWVTQLCLSNRENHPTNPTFTVDSNLCATMLWGRRDLTELQVVGRRQGGIGGGESSSKAICSCVITALGLSWLALCSVWTQGPLTSVYSSWEVNAGSASYIAAYMVLSELLNTFLADCIGAGSLIKKKRNKIIRQWFIFWEKWSCFSKSVYLVNLFNILA